MKSARISLSSKYFAPVRILSLGFCSSVHKNIRRILTNDGAFLSYY